MPDLRNVQSILAHTPPQPRSFILFFRALGNPSGARRFLASLRPMTPHALEDNPHGRAVAYPALSWRALAALAAAAAGLDPEEGRRQLEPAFVERTPDHPGVAGDMGFTGPDAPANWWGAGVTGADLELAVYACFPDEGRAASGVARIRGMAAAEGLPEVRVPAFPGGALNGHRPAGGILHFGYRDGITSPAVDWTGDRPGATDFREFLLGYPNADYPVAPVPEGPWRSFVTDGSFACLAWLRQDVAAFNRFLEEEGGKLRGGPEWLAARVMGRWRDGSPVLRWPDAPPATPDFDDGFGFAADPDGALCPRNAHIRVVNMRDDTMTYPNRSRFPKGPPRLMRRGFTYGPPLGGTADDGVDRGIVGMFLCSRVNEQFYTALRWMNATTFAEGFGCPPHSEAMQDALAGNRDPAKADPGLLAGGKRLALRKFVTYRGVAVLFMPGLQALDTLCGARSNHDA